MTVKGTFFASGGDWGGNEKEGVEALSQREEKGREDISGIKRKARERRERRDEWFEVKRETIAIVQPLVPEEPTG